MTAWSSAGPARLQVRSQTAPMPASTRPVTSAVMSAPIRQATPSRGAISVRIPRAGLVGTTVLVEVRAPAPGRGIEREIDAGTFSVGDLHLAPVVAAALVPDADRVVPGGHVRDSEPAVRSRPRREAAGRDHDERFHLRVNVAEDPDEARRAQHHLASRPARV